MKHCGMIFTAFIPISSFHYQSRKMENRARRLEKGNGTMVWRVYKGEGWLGGWVNASTRTAGC